MRNLNALGNASDFCAYACWGTNSNIMLVYTKQKCKEKLIASCILTTDH